MTSGTNAAFAVSNQVVEQPMRRETLLFASLVFLLIALKYALGQDDGGIAWNVDADPLDDVLSAMIGAPVLGAIFGAIRVMMRRSGRPVLEPIHLD